MIDRRAVYRRAQECPGAQVHCVDSQIEHAKFEKLSQHLQTLFNSSKPEFELLMTSCGGF